MQRLALLVLLWPSSRALAQDVVTTPEPVRAIAAPRVPLPSEGATDGVRRFSFIAYGDTRGRHDGTELQAEHKLVVESMIATIRRATTSADSIRFVLQSGDAVANGSLDKQWSVSYVPLIDRLTTEGGVPYYLAVGNHDVGSSTDLADPRPRQTHRRSESEEKRAYERRGERVGQHLGVDGDHLQPRHVRWAESGQGGDAAVGEPETYRAAGDCEHEAFEQQLPRDPPARRAERRTNADLT